MATFTATVKPSIRSLLVSVANPNLASQDYLKAMTLLAGQKVVVSGTSIYNLCFKATKEGLRAGNQKLNNEKSCWAVSEETLIMLENKYCNPEKPLSLAVQMRHLVEDINYQEIFKDENEEL